MREMLQLYDEVLKDLPFSIIGHNGLPELLYKFYDKLSEASFIKYNENFTFLCSAILKFKKNDDNSHLDWRLESYDKFYYKSFLKVDKRAVVSIYFQFLKRLSLNLNNPEGDEELRPSFIFSELFREDLDFKLSLFENDQPFIDYNRDKQLFEIKLPNVIFNKEYLDHQYDHRLHLIEYFKKIKDHEYFLQNPDEEHSRYYSSYNLKEDDLYNDIEKFLDDIINDFQKEKVINHLKNNLTFFEDLFVKDHTNLEKLFEQFANCCIALSFWCLHYNSAVEYMMSVAKVEKKKLNKRWITEKRNLGGLIVGYNKVYELTGEERAILNLTSDRLTSVVAGQKLFEENKKLVIENNRNKLKQILVAFDNGSFFNSRVSHGTECFTDLEQDIQDQVLRYIKMYNKWLGKDFTKSFSFLLKNNSGYICKYWLTKLTMSTDIHSKSKIENVDCLFAKNLDELLIGEFSSNRINVPFVNSIFKELTEDRDDVKSEILEISKKGIKIICKVKYSPSFNFDSFIEKVRNSKNDKGSFVGTFLIEYYDLLLAHGNFLIKHGEEILFDVEKYIENVSGDEITLYAEVEQKLDSRKKVENKKLEELDLIFINKLEE